MSGPITGALYAIGAALGFALWNLFMQRALERGATVWQSLVVGSLVISGTSLPLLGITSWQNGPPDLVTQGLIYFAAAALLTGGLGPLHSTLATGLIGATQTTALRLLDPFFALAAALFFMQEQLSPQAVGGVVLIAVALFVLQRGSGAGAVGHRFKGRSFLRGIGLAIIASVLFTAGSLLRKLGLAVVPVPLISVGFEGITGLAVTLPLLIFPGFRAQFVRVFQSGSGSLWASGFAVAGASFCLNLALQRLPLPVAVTLRNTAPWCAMALAPFILGAGNRPNRRLVGSTVLLTAGVLLILLW